MAFYQVQTMINKYLSLLTVCIHRQVQGRCPNVSRGYMGINKIIVNINSQRVQYT